MDAEVGLAFSVDKWVCKELETLAGGDVVLHTIQEERRGKNDAQPLQIDRPIGRERSKIRSRDNVLRC